MYGRNVTVYIEGQPVTIFIFCTPSTPEVELRAAAIERIRAALKKG
jgi:hypothetical protein